MKKKKNNIIPELIRHVAPSCLTLVATLLIFYALFEFSRFDMKIFNLGAQLSTFILFTYILISSFFIRKSENLKMELRRLKESNLELKNRITEEKSQIQEYFLMWIHQMKTPITSVKLLSDSTPNEENFNEIRQNILHIENYSNMALNYLKIINSDADLFITEVDLDDIIRENLRKYSILFIANHIRLNYQPTNQKVITDAKWFGVMFEQILSNSVKYTKNGEISIAFDTEEYFLEIRDTGIGIKKSDIPKIFQRGYSGFNGKLQEKSTGIGLFLVNRISKKLNAEVKIESDLNAGTSCKIYLQKEKG